MAVKLPVARRGERSSWAAIAWSRRTFSSGEGGWVSHCWKKSGSGRLGFDGGMGNLAYLGRIRTPVHYTRLDGPFHVDRCPAGTVLRRWILAGGPSRARSAAE